MLRHVVLFGAWALVDATSRRHWCQPGHGIVGTVCFKCLYRVTGCGKAPSHCRGRRIFQPDLDFAVVVLPHGASHSLLVSPPCLSCRVLVREANPASLPVP